MSRASTHALRSAAATAVLSFLVSAGGTVCYKESGDCFSVTKLIQYTGTPTIPCQAGHPVVQIDARANCGNGWTSVRVLRCGASSEGFSFSGRGTLHTFGTLSDWETVLADHCEDLTYSAS